MSTSFDPYNQSVVIDHPTDDQYFNVSVQRSNWVFQRRTCVHACSSGFDFFNISKSSIEKEIDSILSSFDIHGNFRSQAATKILDFARNMIDNTHRNKKYLYLRVDLHVAHIIWYDNDHEHEHEHDDDVDVDDDDDDDDDHVLLDPASKSSIEGLEKVKIDEEINERLSNNDCSICLEGFEVDEEAVLMPCSHLFHKICIVNWLQRKHFCPLCRFQLPTSDDD
ncbi:probable E3 ubiquitin-protein ligase RHG1A [Prosopis cineraria]|uniref:probable E3 ubiquitin-protein ligase RHG1A n=1 Tax=Prosopis cineraria TaxID=364024 RepID=UPI00240FA191|nr:probable E3 ubiquitin-protein ligase RHG1A [Prosopis cineraria]